MYAAILTMALGLSPATAAAAAAPADAPLSGGGTESSALARMMPAADLDGVAARHFGGYYHHRYCFYRCRFPCRYYGYHSWQCRRCLWSCRFHYHSHGMIGPRR